MAFARDGYWTGISVFMSLWQNPNIVSGSQFYGYWTDINVFRLHDWIWTKLRVSNFMDIEQILVYLGLYDKSLIKWTVFNFMDIE